jgi:hypothetical protein
MQKALPAHLSNKKIKLNKRIGKNYGGYETI